MSIEGRKDNRSFNLPDITGGKSVRGVALASSAFGKTTDGSLPKIIGSTQTKMNDNDGTPTGAFYKAESNPYVGFGGSNGHFIKFDAYRCSTAYSRDDNKVIPYGIHVYWCIKF